MKKKRLNKKIERHLKGDIAMFKEEMAEDRALIKKLKLKKKKKKGK